MEAHGRIDTGHYKVAIANDISVSIDIFMPDLAQSRASALLHQLDQPAGTENIIPFATARS